MLKAARRRHGSPRPGEPQLARGRSFPRRRAAEGRGATGDRSSLVACWREL